MQPAGGALHCPCRRPDGSSLHSLLLGAAREGPLLRASVVLTFPSPCSALGKSMGLPRPRKEWEEGPLPAGR